MATLDWIGKKAVLNHHNEVPFHLLQDVPDLSVGDPGTGNLVVEADNLLGLKALLPYFARRVKCVFIDPPYNTGNEDWVYNDNVNSPEIRGWLGKVVGSEDETLDRHDRWLCMMYPRLVLLRDFLTEDGCIFVTIGADEVAHLKMLMDEVFGARNLIAMIAWETAYTANQTAKHISDTHDQILVYGKNFDTVRLGKFTRSEEQKAKFTNPDNDPRGPWKSENLSAGRFYGAGQFRITGPTGKEFAPPPGRYWRCNEEQYQKWLSDGRITFGRSQTGRPMLKKFLAEMKDGLTPTTWWGHTDFGTTKEASLELKALFDGRAVFPTPKPVRLIQRILEIATGKEDIVLDSFAGSATTAHAVANLNRQDAGSRHYVLVEMQEDLCREVTAERMRRLAKGYKTPTGKEVPGLGGGFRYCRLGARCFDEQGRINPEVRFTDLARHVYFTETGEPLPRERVPNSPKIGVTPGGAGIYLLYNGILKDRSADGGNVLTWPVLESLPPHDGPRIIYGTACRISPARRTRENIVFKQIPYGIRTI